MDNKAYQMSNKFLVYASSEYNKADTTDAYKVV